MANDIEMSDWNDLLHSSSKLLDQATSSSQFPHFQRNLEQLEALSKTLKAKALRNEAPSQSIAATRLLAREGINAENLARDIESFELKTTFEDVFLAEATSVEEYLQQGREMAMLSAIKEAQKDNVRSFNDYMMTVLEEDWRKGKRDFLQSLNRISMLPKINLIDTSREAHSGQLVQVASNPIVSSTPGELLALPNIPIQDKKAYVYGEVVKKLNTARERGLPFRSAMCFKDAYETLGAEVTREKSVSMQKIWELVQVITGEDSAVRNGFSKRMSLVIGVRLHLQRGHEKYIMDKIQSQHTQADLGGSVGNLQRIRAFLRIHLKKYGNLDFDSADARRHPPVDTTWQQIYFCFRTGYYEDAMNVARSTRSSQQFAALLTEWISTNGMVSAESAAIASEECEKIFRMGDDYLDRHGSVLKKLLLYTIISGSLEKIERIVKDLNPLFNAIEDFFWFKLSCIRDVTGGSSSGHTPYNLDDLQAYVNKCEPSYDTKNEEFPLLYPYVLLLSIQLLPAIKYLSKKAGHGCYNTDAVHIAICLVDHSVLSEGSGTGHGLSVMDANDEASSMIEKYGSMLLHRGYLQMTVEYYAQAAAAVGGGELAWCGRSNMEQQRQRNKKLMHLLTDMLMREGGIYFLLGARGSGEEGQLARFFPDSKLRQEFLIEAARKSLEAKLFDKSTEIHKRMGAFAAALKSINERLADAIYSLAHGRLDGESRASGLIIAGNDILQNYQYYPEVSLQERELVMEQETILRELEAILSIHNFGRRGNHLDALREIAKLPFLNLDPRVSDRTTNVFQSASPHFKNCVPDLLKVALTCLDNVPDTDGSIRAMRSKIAGFLANNTHQNWPLDLYEKAARSF